jgi:WD40 repeat protein
LSQQDRHRDRTEAPDAHLLVQTPPLAVVLVLQLHSTVGAESNSVKRHNLLRRRVLWALLAATALVSASQAETAGESQRRRGEARSPRGGDAGACDVQELKRSDIQGLKVYSPDGSRFLINKEDERGTAQMYVGMTGRSELTCITCTERSGGPTRERFKMQPRWHPSGKWIFMAVERDKYSPPPILGLSRKYVEGQLQNGIFTNMWAVTTDGMRWQRLSDFKSNVRGTPDGFTGQAFTPDGRHVVWSQIVDGNILRYWPFGRWELILADVQEKDGLPFYTNLKNITPNGMHWNEPGDFAPDGVSLVISGSTEKDAQGQDVYILNIRTGKLTNLTNSPTIWDEHGVFSPDGAKIIMMSAYPYRSDPNASKVLGIKTEFILMNKDGSNLTQLTRFREPGAPEYPSGIAATPQWSHDGRSLSLAALMFPDYEFWDLTFRGPCGRTGAPF